MDSPKSNKTPCPKCGNPLRLGGLAAGEVVRCPKCSAPITVGGAVATKPGRSKNTPAGHGQPDAAKPAQSTPEKQPTPVNATPAKQPRKPTLENPLVIDGSGPPQVVPVHPFIDRQSGELPIAKSATTNNSDDDDDSYEPEIPLIPSAIPDQTIVDANLSSFAEQRREITPGVTDDLQADRPIGPGADMSEMHLESAKRRGLIRRFTTPPPPRWTFFSDVFDFPWRGPNIGRWVMMSAALCLAVGLSYWAMSAMGLFDEHLSMDSLMGIVLGLLAVGFDVIALSLVAAACQTALQDTADGHILPQEHTMPDVGQWIFIALSWLMLGTAAAAIGVPLSLAIGPVAFPIMLWIFFPFLLFSVLETDALLMPFSLPVIRSLGQYIGHWVMFYLLITLMAAVVGAAAYYGFGFSPIATFVLGGPVLATVSLIYFRLLGRLAWKVSGARMAQIELDGPPEDAVPLAAAEQAATSKRSKKRARFRMAFPDDPVPREPEAPPRINFPRP